METLIEEMDVNDIPFFNDTLLYLDTQTIEVEKTRIGSVDLSRVVGTTHPDYHGKRWGQLKPIKGTSKGEL